MHDALQTALATPGLIWMLLTISAAGIVRGFSGFGTALIFVPIGHLFLDGSDVIAVVVLTGIGSIIALMPRALKVAEIKEVSTLALAATLTVPLGLWLLGQLDQLTVRWIAAAISGSMLLALILGWRYRGQLDLKRKFGIGSAAGIFGGLTGLTGPAVILFYLASGTRAEIIRANTILFLGILDAIIIINMLFRAQIDLSLVAIAFVLTVPYFITTRIGQTLFNPKFESTYRIVAYTVIALAVLTGLPLWD